MNPIFIGKITKGKLHLQDRQKFDNYILGLEGDVQIVVGKIKKQRSNNENRYYWGVVVKLLSEMTGYTDDEMHDALRMLFLLDRDKTIPTLRSTASLTTVEFENYMTNIREWASREMNCYIPEPNEVEI